MSRAQDGCRVHRVAPGWRHPPGKTPCSGRKVAGRRVNRCTRPKVVAAVRRVARVAPTPYGGEAGSTRLSPRSLGRTPLHARPHTTQPTDLKSRPKKATNVARPPLCAGGARPRARPATWGAVACAEAGAVKADHARAYRFTRRRSMAENHWCTMVCVASLTRGVSLGPHGAGAKCVRAQRAHPKRGGVRTARQQQGGDHGADRAESVARSCRLGLACAAPARPAPAGPLGMGGRPGRAPSGTEGSPLTAVMSRRRELER